MKDDSRRGGASRQGMSGRKFQEVWKGREGILLFIGSPIRHLKQHHQYENDTRHLPWKTKSTRLVTNKKITRGALIYWHQLCTSKDVSTSHPICWTTHMDQGATDSVTKKHQLLDSSIWLVHSRTNQDEPNTRWSSCASLITPFIFGQTRSHEKLVHPHNRLDGRAIHEIWKK